MSHLEPTLPFAVVLGLSPTGLYAVRELGRAGVPVFGASRSPQCGNASRFLTASFVHADPSVILEHLLERLPLTRRLSR